MGGGEEGLVEKGMECEREGIGRRNGSGEGEEKMKEGEEEMKVVMI